MRYAVTTRAKKLSRIVEADEEFVSESFKGRLPGATSQIDAMV